MKSEETEIVETYKRLLRIFKDGESKRIRKLLSGIELGDLKPSQLLQKLRSLATEDLSLKFIKMLWLEKLPQAIQQILIISEEELDKLAVMADRIAESNPKTEIYEAAKPENETKIISGTENREYENGASRTTKYAIPGLPSVLYQDCQVCYTRSTKYAIPGVPSMLYQDYQVCYTRTTKCAIPGLPSMLYQEYQVCYTRSTKYAIPGLPSMLYQDYQVCYTRTAKYAIPGVPSMLYQEYQVCYTRSTKYAIPGVPSMLYQDYQVCYTTTAKYAIPGVPSMLYQEYQVCYTRSIKYTIPGVPSMLYQDYQVCYTRTAKYAIPGVPSMLYQEYQVCYTRSTKYAIPGVPSMLYQEYQVCYTRRTKYAIPRVSSILYQEYQVCYTRTTKYAIPGLPSMLYQDIQVCYSRTTKYAIPGLPSMLYQECQVCYTRSTKYAIPGEPRMFHKKNQECYTSSGDPIIPASREDPIGPSNKPQPSKPGVRFDLPKETRSGRRIKTSSRYNESIGRDFRHWKGSATETYELIKEAFGDAALSCSRTFEWFSRFQKGREKVNDDQHTGRPRSFRCEENKLKIKELIKSNRRISIKDLSSETGLSVYLGIMRCLREAVRLKRPERWQNNDWILHVGNARPHTAHVVLQFLAKHSTIQIPHPPYSPDLAPNDFFLYPKLKMNLKGRKFDNVDMIQAESKATLRNLSKSDFISCFDNCKKRWNGCIEAGGIQDYHNEGDHNEEGKKTVQIDRRAKKQDGGTSTPFQQNDQAIFPPTTQPNIPQNKPVRSYPPSTL
ncbi:hypothetical protein LAZ67_11003407 [Cordylochernes scorpioides]|uniref:Mos1 transposase HTH domain-containing protein n=1 Tax=Cordylochernes scorpioides TaxID=51811 RepID=A0ABY6L259_9ARAC|nr:hypothetical protein LAZ67_11003407 [Cordylochernes scorpioides]